LHAHVPVTSPTRPLFAALYHLHVAGREGLAAALRFVWYEPLFRSQCAAIGPEFRMEQLPYLQGRGRIVLGRRVRLSGKPLISFSTVRHAVPELVIGDDTFVGHLCGFTVEADRVLDAMLRRQREGVFRNGGGFQNGIVDRYPDGAEFFAWDGKTAGYEGHLVYSWTWLHALFAREGVYESKLLQPLQ
jgi:hypothetical protein